MRVPDLTEIRAVGFDLDHTLAVYDDQAANELAYRETAFLLADRGFDAARMEPPYRDADFCRGLLVSDRGGVLQIDADHVPIRAWSGRGWMDAADLRARFGDGPVDPDDGFRLLSSPFDIPTAALVSRLCTGASGPGEARPDAAVIGTVRTLLDVAHTRGRFKSAILSRVESIVRALDSRAGIEALAGTGLRLFVLTNSDATYTSALLDHLFPAGWRHLFDLVVADAGKPAFFYRESPPTGGRAEVVGSSAAALEDALGVSPGQVLYVGDNPVADTAPARERGWRSALVVPELARDATDPWGDPHRCGDRDTFFARMVRDSADWSAPTLADVVMAISRGAGPRGPS